MRRVLWWQIKSQHFLHVFMCSLRLFRLLKTLCATSNTSISFIKWMIAQPDLLDNFFLSNQKMTMTLSSTFLFIKENPLVMDYRDASEATNRSTEFNAKVNMALTNSGFFSFRSNLTCSEPLIFPFSCVVPLDKNSITIPRKNFVSFEFAN